MNNVVMGALHTSEVLAERFGCRLPIFGLSHSLEVTKAISLAGGMGVWAAARQTPEEIEKGSAYLRESLGQYKFAINLMLPQGLPPESDRRGLEAEIPQEHRDFVDHLYEKYGVPKEALVGERNRIVRSEQFFQDQVDAAMSGAANHFAIAIGSRPEVAKRAKEKGKCVIALVGSPRHMRHVRAMDADLVVAQGADAGGHVGTVGTFSLVPRIVELAGGTPVLAAGGVGTGAHLVAALALGAQGVWLGTLWLGTKEFELDPILMSKLLDAGCEDTVVTRGSSGKPMRQLKTAWSDEWSKPEAPEPLKMPWQDLLVGSLEGSVTRHSVAPLMYTPVGQSVEWIRSLTSVQEVISRLMTEAKESLAALASLQLPETSNV